MEKKNKGNKNKIILEEFNCNIDKMDKDGENKTQRIYLCSCSSSLSKLIVDKWHEDLWRRESLDSSEFYTHRQVLWQGFRIYRVYTYIKIASNTNINHIMVSYTDDYIAISIGRLSAKTKIGKDSWKRFMKIFLFYVSLSSPQLQRLLFIKNTKINHSSASDLWEYTNFRSKDNAKILSKTSTTLENITILKKRLCFFIKNTKINLFSNCLVGKHQI